VDIRWRAFPLHPETPEEGTLLEELFSNVSSEDLRKMKDRLKQAADEAGLPFADRTMTYNSRLAQELGKWAESKGSGDSFHRAAFSAYFAEGINIAKIPALVDIAASIGLPGEEAEEVLVHRTFKSEVDDDWSLSRNIGITAVPTFVMNGGRLVGAQPYEMLEELMGVKGIRKRAKG
jgi:predicted DsbA family dithiol-disulfide isomerase